MTDQQDSNDNSSNTPQGITLDELVVGFDADVYAVNEWLTPLKNDFTSVQEIGLHIRGAHPDSNTIKARIEALRDESNSLRKSLVKQITVRGNKSKVDRLAKLFTLCAEILDATRQPTITSSWDKDRHEADVPGVSKLTDEERMRLRYVRELLAYMPGPDLFNYYFGLEDSGLPTFTSNEDIRRVLKKKEDGWETIEKLLYELLKIINEGRRLFNVIYDGNIQGKDIRLNEKAGQLATLIYKIIPSAEKVTEEVDADINEEADRILRSGKPIDYFLDIWARDYVGMTHYGRSLLFSMLCATCNNTLGLNPAADGESGSGKTYAMQAMINLNSRRHTISGSCTPKALMYNDFVTRGTTVFIDDVGKMDEELARIIKVSCSNYQQGFDHLTVSNQEGERKRFPEGINWWMTGVDAASFDIQLLNRNVNVALDEKDKKLKKLHQQKVHEHQREDTITGRPAFQVTREVLVCREMSRILLDADPVNVSIPWIDDPELPKDHPDRHIVEWTGEDNPRNWPILTDMIRVSASIHRYQRQIVNGSIVASIDDYFEATQCFSMVAREQVSKFNKRDQALLETLKKLNADKVPVDIYTISETMKKGYNTVYYWLNGDKNKGIAGFLTRAGDMVTTDDITETEYDTDVQSTDMGRERETTTGSKSKKRTRIRLLTTDDPLLRTGGVVNIDTDRAQRVYDNHIRKNNPDGGGPDQNQANDVQDAPPGAHAQ